jgi:hypothetical protein
MKQFSPLILLSLLSSGCSSLESLRVSSSFFGDVDSTPKTTVASAPDVPQPPVEVVVKPYMDPGIIESKEGFTEVPFAEKIQLKEWRSYLGMNQPKVDRSNDTPVVDVVGDKLVDMEPPTGRLKTIPALAKPVVSERNLNPRNPADAEVMAMENRWFHENVWLYPDQKYAIKHAQNIKGKWNKTGGLLRMQPYHGGLLLFSKGAHGNWVSEAGGDSVLRPVK